MLSEWNGLKGCTFHDGYIWVTSGYHVSDIPHIYAIDPVSQDIAYTITLPNGEPEGCAFVNGELWYSNTENGGSFVFKKITFTTIEEAELPHDPNTPVDA